MNFKKMTVLFVTAAFLLSGICASASTISAIKYEVKDSFNDLSVTSDISEGIRNWQSDNIAGLSVAAGESGNAVCLENTSIKKTVTGNLAKNEYYELSFDVYGGGENSAAKVNLLDGSGNIKAQTIISTSGVSVGSESDKYQDGTYQLAAGAWSAVKIKFSGYSASVSVFINETEAAKNVIIPGLASASGIAGIEIADGADGEDSITVDNVLLTRMTDAGQIPSEINFSTDFEEMTMESRQLPDGFYPNGQLLNNFKNVGMKQFDDEHSKALKIMTSYSMGAMLYFRNIVTDTVTISWQEYSESGTVPFIKAAAGNGSEPVLKRCGTVYGQDTESTIAFDRWVDVKLVIDATSGKISLTYDGNTTETSNSDIKNYGCSGLLFGGSNGAGYNKNSIYYDNLKVSGGSVSESGGAIGCHIDFEDYTLGGEYRAHMMGAKASDGWHDPGNSYIAYSKIIDTEDGVHNKAFYLNLPLSKSPDYTGNVTAGLNMPQFADCGVATLKMSVFIENRNTPNFQVRSGETPAKENQLVLFDVNKGISFNTVSSGSYEPDRWYDIELTIDLDKDTLSGRVTDDTGAAAASVSDISLGTVNRLDKFLFRTTNRETTQDYGVIIDNISIDYTAGAPYMKDVVFQENGTVVSGDPVSTLVDEIHLEYNAKLDGNSIASKVTLQNRSGKEVKFVGHTTGNTYIIKPETYLEANGHYVLTVDAGVKSATGEESETAEVYEFDIADGIKNAVIDSVTVDGTEAVLDSFLPNKEVSTRIRYINTKNEPSNMYIIYVYYLNNKKVDYVFEKYLMTTDMQNLTLETVIPVPSDVPEFDEVRVFVWDGLKKMSPIADFKGIN